MAAGFPARRSSSIRTRDVVRLEEQLAAAGGFRRRLIVTDSLFSMDGDLAPLVQLAELAQPYDAMLLVDEAHATGVFGRHGRGVSEHFDVPSKGLVRIGTLSKALGCSGGFVDGSRTLIDWLLNRVRPYVFSTAAPAANAAAALAALDILRERAAARGRAAVPRRRIREELRHRLGHRQERKPDHSADRGRAGCGNGPLRAASRAWLPCSRHPSAVRAGGPIFVASQPELGAHAEMIDGLLGALKACR